MPPKRAVSAYFLFSKEHRQAVQDEYLAQTGTKKISAATVAKLLGEKWRGMAEAEREPYQKLAAGRAAEMAQQVAKHLTESGNAIEGLGEDEKEHAIEDNDESRQICLFPWSLIKRIMQVDKQVKRVPKDIVKAMSMAAELVIGALTERAYQEALKNNRKTIQFTDIEKVIITDKRWEPSGMRELMLTGDLFKDARKGGAGKPGRQKSKDDPKERQITSFFTAP